MKFVKPERAYTGEYKCGVRFGFRVEGCRAQDAGLHAGLRLGAVQV